MVDIKLHIDEDFFNEEEREGYLVTREMKEIWAVELDLLNEFMTFCGEHDLRWFVDGGTQLGTARHQGFVPWDDDIDILMPREDYETFLQTANFEAPYFLQTPETDEGFVAYHSRLQRPDTTAISVNSHNCRHAFKQGIFIDIFPLDKTCDVLSLKGDIKDVNDLKKSACALRDDAYINEKAMPVADILDLLNQGKTIIRSHADSTNGLMYSYSVSGSMHNLRFERDYESAVQMPFEMLTVNAPVGIDTSLSMQYGNWHKVVKGKSYHKMWKMDASKPYTEYLGEEESNTVTS